MSHICFYNKEYFFRFLAEESYPGPGKFILTNDPTWIIDPIDGTTNFVHGLPMIAISIALFIDSAPVVGIIYNPITEQLYTAVKGQGAFLNGSPIKVSGQTGTYPQCYYTTSAFRNFTFKKEIFK